MPSGSVSPSPSAGPGGTIIILNDLNPFLASEGQTLLLQIDDSIYFCLTGSNFCPIDQRHTITLESLSPSTSSAEISVTILIASTPTKYTLYLGRPLDIDVNGDGIPDIRITLKSLTGSSAEINFISLSPASTVHLFGTLGVGG